MQVILAYQLPHGVTEITMTLKNPFGSIFTIMTIAESCSHMITIEVLLNQFVIVRVNRESGHKFINCDNVIFFLVYTNLVTQHLLTQILFRLLNYLTEHFLLAGII